MKIKLIKIIKELQEIVDSLPKEETKETRTFKPTPEQIERWKNISPTKKTIQLLQKKGFSAIEIMAIKTQYDANILLNSLKKENI